MDLLEEDTSAQAEDTQEEDVYAGTLTFTDAAGLSHTMDINGAAKQNDYDTGAFVLNGQDMSYTDIENYTYRLGIDVSYYQGDIDWDAAAAAGYEFAFIRIGSRGYSEEGKITEDENFRTNLEEAQAAGFDVGVYFFSQAVSATEAEEEAEFTLSTLEGAELALPVIYDPEYIYDSNGDKLAEARTSTLDGEQITEDTRTFCQVIEDAGYDAAFYASMLSEAEVFDMEELSEYTVWYADYNAVPQTPYAYTYWQYAETGSVDGIDTEVDLNIQLIPVY